MLKVKFVDNMVNLSITLNVSYCNKISFNKLLSDLVYVAIFPAIYPAAG